jgi:hypothetical protein
LPWARDAGSIAVQPADAARIKQPVMMVRKSDPLKIRIADVQNGPFLL